jgi:sulfatase modifying factor 1
MRLLLLSALIFLGIGLSAQNIPVLKFIEGGTQVLGGGYQYKTQDYYMVLLGNDSAYAAINADQTVIGEVPSFNNPNRRVTCASFFMSETEITNAQYRFFLVDSLLNAEEQAALELAVKNAKKGSADAAHRAWQPLFQKAGDAGLLPDSSCWTREFVFAYNEPLVHNYFWHPAFDPYPVVGVSWVQANAYCNWLSTHVNRELARKGKPLMPNYRLPSEAEWEYAAKPKNTSPPEEIEITLYPWKGGSVRDEKGRFRANIKTDHGDYIGDNYEYTAPVKSFAANDFGLYDMAGNVSEWCIDVMRFSTKESMQMGDFQRREKLGHLPIGPQLFEAAPPTDLENVERVVKGGSWADYRYAAMTGSRTSLTQQQGGPRIGFRVAMIKMGDGSRTEL